jgi:hypothetical protein
MDNPATDDEEDYVFGPQDLGTLIAEIIEYTDDSFSFDESG